MGFDADIHQNIGIIVPAPDAIQITGAALVVDDEGNDAMPEAFFENDQSAYTPVAIFVGADTFKLYMEVQYIFKVNGLLRLVFLDQIRHRSTDLCGRRSFSELLRCGCFAISDRSRSVAAVLAAVTEKLCLQPIDEGLCQRLHCVGQDRINAEKMVSGFYDIIDLDVFAGGEDAIFLIQDLDLIAGQAIGFRRIGQY